MEYLEQILPKKFLNNINTGIDYTNKKCNAKKTLKKNAIHLCKELLKCYPAELIDKDLETLLSPVFNEMPYDRESKKYNISVLHSKEYNVILESLNYNKYYELITIVQILLDDCFSVLSDIKFIELYNNLKLISLVEEKISEVCMRKNLDYASKINKSNSYTELLVLSYYNLI